MTYNSPKELGAHLKELCAQNNVSSFHFTEMGNLTALQVQKVEQGQYEQFGVLLKYLKVLGYEIEFTPIAKE